MKNLFTIIMILISMMSQAQNYTVKGVVIDANAKPIIGAQVKTNKSKNVAYTDSTGIYSINVTARDKELLLSLVNGRLSLSKQISQEIAKMPVNFAVDDIRPIAGYLSKDLKTYYVGTTDVKWEDIIIQFGGIIYQDGNVYYNKNNEKKVACRYIFDGQLITNLHVVDVKNIYSISFLKNNDPELFKYGYVSAHLLITSLSKHSITSSISNFKKYIEYKNDDTLRGIVKDGWGRPVDGLKIKSPSGEMAITDTSGYYAIKINKKDTYLRTIMKYTEGTTVRIAKENKHAPINLTVMLRQNGLRGWWSEDMKTYYPGEDESDMESLISHFIGTKYDPAEGLVYLNLFNPTLAKKDMHPVSYYEVDGSPVKDLLTLTTNTIYSISVVKDGTENIYGGAGQYGAIIIKTKGMLEAPVELTDWEAQKAKKIPGKEGMKSFIATQGKGLVYDDGKIIIDGKTCELYIINDKEFSHMLGIEANMIDDIIIIRTGGVPAYGEKAKNGVVLISASEKEKKAINEQGETVTGKEAKKVQRKAKK